MTKIASESRSCCSWTHSLRVAVATVAAHSVVAAAVATVAAVVVAADDAM